MLTWFGQLGYFVRLPESFILWPQSMERNLLHLTWTLSFELYFYIITAALLFFRIEARRIIAASIIFLSLSYNIYLIKTGGYLPENQAKITMLQVYGASPFLIEFFLGYLAAGYISGKNTRTGDATIWIAGALAAFCIAYYYQFKTGLDNGGMAGFFHYTERCIIFGAFSTFLVAAALIYEKSGITPLRPLQKLGDASYSIYLSHGLCVLIAIKLCGMLGVDVGNSTLASIAVLLFVFSWALLSYHAIELKLYRLFKRVLRVNYSNNICVAQ